MLREWLVKKLDVLARPTENPAIQALPSAWAGHGPRCLRAPSYLSLVAAGLLVFAAPALTLAEPINFKLTRSAAAKNANCLLDAAGHVEVQSIGPAELMEMTVKGLPPNTEFDVFVIQLPNAPFGLSWYQGDIETDGDGVGHAFFVGRFSIETFIVAPGSGPAPRVHNAPIADATTNPATAPVHTYHVGVWFNSPADAAAAGCPATVTPFNGDHSAGIQALSTRKFADDQGPLRQLVP
jgi:hypothetical protein